MRGGESHGPDCEASFPFIAIRFINKKKGMKTMKKTLRKLIAIVLALGLLTALCIPAAAEDGIQPCATFNYRSFSGKTFPIDRSFVDLFGAVSKTTTYSSAEVCVNTASKRLTTVAKLSIMRNSSPYTSWYSGETLVPFGSLTPLEIIGGQGGVVGYTARISGRSQLSNEMTGVGGYGYLN